MLTPTFLFLGYILVYERSKYESFDLNLIIAVFLGIRQFLQKIVYGIKIYN